MTYHNTPFTRPGIRRAPPLPKGERQSMGYNGLNEYHRNTNTTGKTVREGYA